MAQHLPFGLLQKRSFLAPCAIFTRLNAQAIQCVCFPMGLAAHGTQKKAKIKNAFEPGQFRSQDEYYRIHLMLPAIFSRDPCRMDRKRRAMKNIGHSSSKNCEDRRKSRPKLLGRPLPSSLRAANGRRAMSTQRIRTTKCHCCHLLAAPGHFPFAHCRAKSDHSHK